MTSMVQGTHLAEDPPARRRWTASTRHGHPGPTLGPEKEEIGSAQMPYATVNPYTNELVKSFPDATDEEVDAVQYGVHLLVGRVGERLDELIGVRVDRCVRHLRAPYLFLLGSEGRAWMSMTCGGRPPTPSRRVLREMRPLNHRRHVPSSRCRYIGTDIMTVAPNV